MSEKPRLSKSQLRILIGQGVVKMPPVPAVSALAEHIKARGGDWTITVNRNGFASARVTMFGHSFDGGGDAENQALVEALCQALTATQPTQASFVPDEDEDEESDDEEEPAAPFTASMSYGGRTVPFNPGAPTEEAKGLIREVVRDSFTSHLLKPEATPEQMAQALNANGLPISFDAEAGAYVNRRTGDTYDGAEGRWVEREFRSLPRPVQPHGGNVVSALQ